MLLAMMTRILLLSDNVGIVVLIYDYDDSVSESSMLCRRFTPRLRILELIFCCFSLIHRSVRSSISAWFGLKPRCNS